MSIRRRYWTNAKGEQKEAWIADYVDQHGKRHIKTFKSQKAANEWLPHTQGRGAAEHVHARVARPPRSHRRSILAGARCG